MTRRYKELIQLETFDARFKYLHLGDSAPYASFGDQRILNQEFYRSPEWHRTRRQVIIRDNGCDMAVEGFDIHDKIIVHHIQPVTLEMIENGDPLLFDLDNLVCVSHHTHNAIHYGSNNLYNPVLIERRPGDTKLW